MMMGKDPEEAYRNLYASNPQFRVFADSVSGMTPEEAFRSKGFDFNTTMQNILQQVNQFRGSR